ncbi:MAG: hypothetical protein EOM23_05150, partial [Candidatus Moranbacteria bacterium]|nr:hypothetical protein [Candidatus Moranbacteria bacterium]
MKKFTVLMLCVAFSLFTTSFAQHKNIFDDIENPSVISRNKLEPRAFSIPYASVEQAFEANWEKSGFFKSLNGDWYFHWAEHIDRRPEKFFALDFDHS